ncbi:isoprenylcysteine carboxylmethyltransferase family protein [Chlorobaculum sp. MV4-Y]|jgi:protein-S-isoprenylcysteine O-methyltransferase Ste14|uniref:methyltransferase family protein n=1 Tax=Chlorobaculum sp. MV4-Y TaxID=2976335 RepID=UPI0021AFBEEF|nr:isoprenylcysteine carboxylmethyltransferase family protein [Chlorobaculum sp. MV4-Y]UWX58094.1 isoprenylcysteine carboxylmethyltransferase family protein [Chlorobaculum sp. MV4-Y]
MERPLDTSKRFGARGEYLVVIQIVLAALYIFIPAWPDLRNGDLYQRLTLLRWCVLAIGIIVGAILGIGGSLTIHRYLTPLPYPVDHSKLVDTGVYAWVRHPLYSAQLFAAAGWAVFSLSLSHLLVTALGLAFFNYKASKEEAWLTERHPEYRDYAAKVGKFAPGLGRLKK